MTLSTKDTKEHEEADTFFRSSGPVQGMTNDEALMTNGKRSILADPGNPLRHSTFGIL